MQASVSYLLYEVPVHRFLAVELEAIRHITDFVGGVPVEMLPDFQYMADVEPGKTLLLDGEMAMQYVGERSLPYMDGTNLSRMVRQRQFLFALLSVIKQKTKEDITFLYRLYVEMEPYLNTDMGLREMANIGSRVLLGNTEENIQLHVMDGEMDELEYVINDDFLRTYVQQTFFVPEK